jgi:hypothetical protein
MNAVLSPIVSEFETQEQADSYDRWLQEKLQRAEVSAATQPMVPHDQAMSEIRAMLQTHTNAN